MNKLQKLQLDMALAAQKRQEEAAGATLVVSKLILPTGTKPGTKEDRERGEHERRSKAARKAARKAEKARIAQEAKEAWEVRQGQQITVSSPDGTVTTVKLPGVRKEKLCNVPECGDRCIPGKSYCQEHLAELCPHYLP